VPSSVTCSSGRSKSVPLKSCSSGRRIGICLQPDFAVATGVLAALKEGRMTSGLTPRTFYLFNIEPRQAALCSSSGADFTLDGRYIAKLNPAR
jgi:hypothetical protein